MVLLVVLVCEWIIISGCSEKGNSAEAEQQH